MFCYDRPAAPRGRASRALMVCCGLFLATLAQACAPGALGGLGSRVQEFGKVQYDAPVRDTTGFRLARADRAARELSQELGRRVTVPQLVLRYDARDVARAKSNPVLYQMVDVQFPGLTEDGYEALLRAYPQHEKNREGTFDPNMLYTLRDFMPRIVQATLALRFRPQTVLIDQEAGAVARSNADIDEVVALDANCWGTAYEYLRNDPEALTIFFRDGKDLEDVFLTDEYSHVVKTFTDPSAASRSPAARNRGLEPGDVLVITRNGNPVRGDNHQEGDLLHVAIVVDDDLYFEKTSSSGETTYRFVTFDDLEAPASRSLDNTVWTFRRFGDRPLPLPEDLAQPKRTIKTATGDRVPYLSDTQLIRYAFNRNTQRFFLPKIAFSKAGFIDTVVERHCGARGEPICPTNDLDAPSMDSAVDASPASEADRSAPAARSVSGAPTRKSTRKSTGTGWHAVESGPEWKPIRRSDD